MKIWPERFVRLPKTPARYAGWVTFYVLALVIFIFVIYWQSSKVNTLNFPSGTITLTTSKQKYNVGETVSYTITNGLNSSVLLPATCPAEPLHVYTWNGTAWVALHANAATAACENLPKQTELPPGKTLTQDFSKWPDLFAKPGIYRVVALANNYNGLPYADFEIGTPPKKIEPTVIYRDIYHNIYTPVYLPSPQEPTQPSQQTPTQPPQQTPTNPGGTRDDD